MKKLDEFKNYKLDKKMILQVKGGLFKEILLDKILKETWKLARTYIFNEEEMEKYGRRMMETGSPGGHK